MAIKGHFLGGTWMAQLLDVCLWLWLWSQDRGMESYIWLPVGWEAYFSLSRYSLFVFSPLLSLSLCQLNK